MAEEKLKNDVCYQKNTSFEVVEKDDVIQNEETEHDVKNVQKSFPKEYIEALIRKYNERTTQKNQTDEKETKEDNMNNTANAQSDEDEYEYQYYHNKIQHDIEWNAAPNDDDLFIISKDLFDCNDDAEKFTKNTQNGNKITAKTKSKQKQKWKFNSSNHKSKTKEQNNDNEDNDSEMETESVSWTESINSMLIHAKHRMYSYLANPSFKWDSRSNRHLFCLSESVYILGTHYPLSSDNKASMMQSIVLDIYSKIWITYRSKFSNIGGSRYTSDAGWGCMLRTTQMMTAQALFILRFDYFFKVTLIKDQKKREAYFDILSLFNDSVDAPLSLHNMIKHGRVLYNKPIGIWYGPNQCSQMIKRCIQSTTSLSKQIECILCDSAIIYKSDIDLSLNKHFLIFLPLRLGLDALNKNYIEGIKHCFHLKECIGIIGGKPQKSLYFIGYQQNKLFYLDPHTVFPSPICSVPLSKQNCPFHCQEINSLDANQLDPSMAIAFFIKPCENDLESFWQNATKLMNRPYSMFSLAEQRPNYEQEGLDEFDKYGHSDSNLDNEWEKI